jgi:ribosomal protein L9
MRKKDGENQTNQNISQAKKKRKKEEESLANETKKALRLASQCHLIEGASSSMSLHHS